MDEDALTAIRWFDETPTAAAVHILNNASAPGRGQVRVDGINRVEDYFKLNKCYRKAISRETVCSVYGKYVPD